MTVLKLGGNDLSGRLPVRSPLIGNTLLTPDG